jgi:hypothetical protein
MTNPPSLQSAHTTVHLTVPTCDALLATTVPRVLREASHLHPCLMRRRSLKSSSPYSPNRSLQRCKLTRGCILTMAPMESTSNHNSHRIGARTRIFLVRDPLISRLRVRFAVTTAQCPKCMTTTPTLPTDRMVVWWTWHSNQKPFPLWDYPSVGWNSYRTIPRTVTRPIQRRAVCGRLLMRGRLYKIPRCLSRSRISKTRTWGSLYIWMGSSLSECDWWMVNAFVNIRECDVVFCFRLCCCFSVSASFTSMTSRTRTSNLSHSFYDSML